MSLPMNRLCLVLALLVAPAVLYAEMPRFEFHDDFSKGTAAWEMTDPAAWKTIALEQGKALSQFRQSKYQPPYRSPFNMALVKDVIAGDFILDAEARSTAPDNPHRDLCLFFGYQDPAHFYYVHLGKRADEHSNQVFIVDGAPRRKISTRSTPGTPWDSGWHHLRIARRVGSGSIEVYFDDLKTPAMVANDRTFTWGRAGIGSFDDTGDWRRIELRGVRAAGRKSGRVVLVAGGGEGGDGSPAVTARLHTPFGVDFDRAGNLYFVELLGHRAGRIDTRGVFHTFAGTGKKGDGGDGGPARAAEFNGMHSLAVAAGGDVYLADTWNNRVRRIEAATGIVRAFAGTGDKGFAGDGGPAAAARFGGIYCIAFDPRRERLYLADLDNHRIRAVDSKTGTVTTVAGNGAKGVPEDGAEATRAPLVDPRAVAVDGRGQIYILERSGHCLRVVDTAGRIRTVAGTGKPGASGDGGDARRATFNGPKHLCIDHDGGVLIADTENHLVRKYLPDSGKIIRVAGTGIKGTAGVGGPPEKVQLNQPHGVTVHANGDLYIADSSNDRILKIER